MHVMSSHSTLNSQAGSAVISTAVPSHRKPFHTSATSGATPQVALSGGIVLLRGAPHDLSDSFLFFLSHESRHRIHSIPKAQGLHFRLRLRTGLWKPGTDWYWDSLLILKVGNKIAVPPENLCRAPGLCPGPQEESYGSQV